MRFAGNSPGLSLDGFNPKVSSGTNVGSAADTAQLGAIFGTYRKNAPSYGKINQVGLAARSAEKQAAIAGEASIASTQLLADAEVKAAKLQAKAAKDAAASQARGSMMGSVFGAIGSIGVGLLSDERTKNTIESIDDALSTLRQLKPVSFYYNEEYSSNPERLHYGFIAQDYAKVMPDAAYYDESLEKMCIDTSELIGLLVRSVQQLETKITRLEAANALVGVK